MTNTTHRGRGRPRDPKIDETIMRVTCDIIRDRGLQGVTVAEIVARAGIPKSTFYRRHASLSTIVERASRSMGGYLQWVVTGPDGDPHPFDVQTCQIGPNISIDDALDRVRRTIIEAQRRQPARTRRHDPST